MRKAVFGVFLALVVAGAAAGQQPAETPAPQHPAFKLDLGPILLPGYGPARELRMALWDSPMSRLELAVAREQWAVRHPGPVGLVTPFDRTQLPLRLNFVSGAQSALAGPWSPEWRQLTWQERVAAGAQTGLFLWVLVEAARHVR